MSGEEDEGEGTKATGRGGVRGGSRVSMPVLVRLVDVLLPLERDPASLSSSSRGDRLVRSATAPRAGSPCWAASMKTEYNLARIRSVVESVRWPWSRAESRVGETRRAATTPPQPGATRAGETHVDSGRDHGERDRNGRRRVRRERGGERPSRRLVGDELCRRSSAASPASHRTRATSDSPVSSNAHFKRPLSTRAYPDPPPPSSPPPPRPRLVVHRARPLHLKQSISRDMSTDGNRSQKTIRLASRGKGCVLVPSPLSPLPSPRRPAADLEPLHSCHLVTDEIVKGLGDSLKNTKVRSRSRTCRRTVAHRS